MHTKFLIENHTWSTEKTIILNVAFTPGSLSLTAYRLTSHGFEFLRSNPNPNPSMYTNACYEKTQLLLS